MLKETQTWKLKSFFLSGLKEMMNGELLFNADKVCLD